MLDKTPLEMALEREGQIEYCDECEYVRVVDNTVFCGLSGKLLHPMMFLRGQGFGPARRYDELILMLKAGQIRNLRLQQQYTLQESYITETGERVRAIHYVADFAYERPTAPDKYGTVFWLPVVEDVKSRATKTAQYEMKKKLLRERFNLTITEV